MPPTPASLQESALTALKSELGENLYSCCLYGSAVRGNAIPGVSDLNFLIVLHESTPAAHEAAARALERFPAVDPFIHARRGFHRSARAFAVKFASISRNYRVLHGADPFAEIKIDPELEKFLCEQAVRNLRLRLVYSFVTRSRHKSYDRFIVTNVTTLFVQCSEALRLEGFEIPRDFSDRIPLLEREMKIDGSLLRDLLDLKRDRRRLPAGELPAWHQRVFSAVDAALRWIEARWSI